MKTKKLKNILKKEWEKENGDICPFYLERKDGKCFLKSKNNPFLKTLINYKSESSVLKLIRPLFAMRHKMPSFLIFPKLKDNFMKAFKKCFHEDKYIFSVYKSSIYDDDTIVYVYKWEKGSTHRFDPKKTNIGKLVITDGVPERLILRSKEEYIKTLRYPSFISLIKLASPHKPFFNKDNSNREWLIEFKR